MTDGGDTVIKIARDMAPASEHILDWFHVTMRITVMHQYVKGLAHLNPDEAEEMARRLRQIKGYLWNGNMHDGQVAIDDLTTDLDDIETEYASIKALRKAANEFQTYYCQQCLDDPQLCGAAALWRASVHRFCRKHCQHRRGKTFLQAPANALVKNRGSSYAANPHAHAGRKPAHEVPAMVSRHEIR